MTKKFTWTKEAVEALETLWRESVNTSDIAKILGVGSKNSVIGKARRLGLPVHTGARRPVVVSVIPSKGKQASRHDFQRARVAHDAIKRARIVNLDEIERKQKADALRSQRAAERNLGKGEPIPMDIPIIELSDFTCRWVSSAGSRDALATYCGHMTHRVSETSARSPFCKYHHNICYTSTQIYKKNVREDKAA